MTHSDAPGFDAVDVIETEAARFAAILADTDPAAPCPTCPDWSAADLLWHLVEVHTFWSRILAEGVQGGDRVGEIEDSPPPRPETVTAMLPLRAHATAALAGQLSVLADDEPRWSWWDDDQTVGFTRRMQVCEATIHRVDAELTAGVEVKLIAPAVAAAAVDHCVDVMWGWMPDWPVYETLATVELQGADTGQRWLVDVGHWTGTGPESGRVFDEPRAIRAAEGSEPTVTVTGPVHDLALWAWTRGDGVSVTGEPDGVAALDALMERGIQ